MSDETFYVEDVCSLKEDGEVLGIVEKTVHDVDSHTPHPQQDYARTIECHGDINDDDFQRFMRNGVPPQGTALVVWSLLHRTELITCNRLTLVDRSILVGDVVKRTAEDAMSGTVIGTEMVCTLEPYASRLPLTAMDLMARHGAHGRLSDQLVTVPAEELTPATPFLEGGLMVYKDWVGRVEDVFDEVSIRLCNGSVVQVKNPDHLETLRADTYRLEVGDMVRTKKWNLRRGRWIFGAFDANCEPFGDIVDVRTTSIVVSWICPRVGGPSSFSKPAEPPIELNSDILYGGEVHVYNRCLRPRDHASRLTHNQSLELQLGNRVKFKDIASACQKYDGTRSIPMHGQPSRTNHLKPFSRTSTLGFDLNVFLVCDITTNVTVQWQDRTVTSSNSTELIPDLNVEDENEMWPGELVVPDERNRDRKSSTWKPSKLGVVQSVNAADRIAKVLWQESAQIEYLVDTEGPGCWLKSGSVSGLPLRADDLEAKAEEVSLYEIRDAPDLNRRRGDFVFILRPWSDDDSSASATEQEQEQRSHSTVDINRSAAIDWLGEVVDLGLDGLLTIRLGALEETREIKVPPEITVLAYTSDNNFLGDDLDMDSLQDSEDSMWSEAGELEQAVETWYENEDGTRIENASSEDEDWSTEPEGVSADEDGDTPMTDVESSAVVAIKDDKMLDATENLDKVSNAATSGSDRPVRKPRSKPKASTESKVLAGSPPKFDLLETDAPNDHHYVSDDFSSQNMRRIHKEHGILGSSLPEGVYVRSWESRLDLLRVLIVGPMDTPYEFAPFLIDMHFPNDYPQSPPQAHFHSWTNGSGPVNPNLYEDGKICLSLLGTWHTEEKTESWSPIRSTVLQVIVSILGLVLVKEPYYNEAGFEARAGSADAVIPSAIYSERTYFRSRAFITHALDHPISGFEDVLKWLYLDHGDGTPRLLDKAIAAARDLVEGSLDASAKRGGLERVSKGAVVILKKQLEILEKTKARQSQVEQQ